MVARLAEYGHNATDNINDAFTNMTLQSWIRLTVIVGGYMLLRPYIMKLSTKFAVKKLEEDAKSQSKEKADPTMTPNEFRGIKEKLYEAQDEVDGSGADWGSNARLRQRQMLKDLLEEEERRRAAENEDADIQEFLED
ncbi:protein trafficking PGA2 domain-containing protein [Hirsutella rhossiliensis]|uniref:Protein trafficking PGA2 domain-containing protein n=1 Tax=Hirsutella rhossiliensis TaxID=111463 RepID=A0A9P8SKR3_9HYPO|nr:protein trafficking PGA2 domain-containing protein [Hirsutella rhossiliensis]KAH0965045.1 protein trafficking PGA2 domain-containing protein [Hirsutella rhossiliensis]